MAHALVGRGRDGLPWAALDVLPWREAEVLVGAGGTALVAWQGLAPPLPLTPPPPTDRAPHPQALWVSHVGTGSLLQAAEAHSSVVEVVDHASSQDCACQQEQQADHDHCHSPPPLKSLNLSVVWQRCVRDLSGGVQHFIIEQHADGRVVPHVRTHCCCLDYFISSNLSSCVF